MTTQYALYIWDEHSPNGVTFKAMESALSLPYIMAVHTTIRDVQTCLENVALLFDQAVKWDKVSQTEATLKTIMAEFQFKFSHTQPFNRGNAAVAEWLTQAIYKTHGYLFELRGGWKSLDQQSFGVTEMDAFIAGYLVHVKLLPLGG